MIRRPLHHALAACTSTLVVVVLALFVLLVARPAAAQDRRAEAVAADALKRSAEDYLMMSFDKGLGRLQRAARACEGERCSPGTRALLLRDIGTFQFRLGDQPAAVASMTQALRLDPSLGLNPDYDARDLRVVFDAAKDAITQASQPTTGDFVHAPFREQANATPIPVYVELAGTQPLASVVVKYKNDAMGAFKRTVLRRVAAGWGGYIPCADVTLGEVRYYVQGFDAQGAPVANTGDPKHPFIVHVRESIAIAPPTLPGTSPPKTCGEEELEALHLEDGERCREDNQCKSGACASGICARSQASADVVTEGFARVWIGVSSSVDLALLPSGSDVCRRSSPTPAYFCTNPDGTDYPTTRESAALIAGHAGNPPGGFAAGTVHVLLTFDYAVTPSLLLGARFGYVAESYTGNAAVTAGRALGVPLHGEVRGTYLFGREPLVRGGLAPFAFLAAGVSHFDMSTTVGGRETGIVGNKALEAWVVGGPWFAALGAGVRYAVSPLIGFWAGAKLSAAFGSGGLMGVASPEVILQRGF